MTPPRRLVLGIAAVSLAVAAAGCRDSGGSGDPTADAPMVPVIANGTTEGVATAFDPGLERTDPTGDVRLDTCRWRGPGMVTFDMTFEPDEGVDLPTTFWIGLDVNSGDTGTGSSGSVTLDGAGAFSITTNPLGLISAPDHPPDGGESWATSPDFGTCSLATSARGSVEHGAQLEPVVDLYDDAVTMPPGSVEDLARGVDPTDRTDPLRPLRILLSHPDLPPLDRLYMVPGTTLTGIRIEEDGPCLSVRSNWSTSDDTVDRSSSIEIAQMLGCVAPMRFGPQRVIGVEDDVWTVEVKGPAELVDALAERIELRWFATVDPFAGDHREWDADAAADARLAIDELVEVARISWSDGIVSITTGSGSNWGDTYDDPIVETPQRFLWQGTGRSCLGFGTLVAHDGLRGFAYVVVDDPTNRVQLTDPNGRRTDLALIPGAGGRAVAFVDLTGDPQPELSAFEVVDDDGDVLACDQSPAP